MRSTKKQVYLSVAVALGLGAVQTASAAALDLDNLPVTPVKYAQEINIEASGGANLVATAAADYSVTVKSGWGVSSGNNLYYRFDLTNGQFGTTKPTLTVDGVAASVAQSSGSFIIFNATAPAAGITTGSTVTLDFATPGASVVPTTRAPVKVQYRAFTNPTDAINGTNPAKTVSATSVIDFAKFVEFGVSPSGEISITALNNFGQFNGNTQLATVGSFWVTPAAVYSAAGTALTDLSSVISGSSYLEVKGNFTSMTPITTAGAVTTLASGLFLTTDAACMTLVPGITATAVAGTGTASGTIDSVKLTGIPTGGLGTSGAPTYLCYNDKAGTAESIAKSTYTLQLVTTPASTSYAAQTYAKSDVGSFVRAGTELQASFVAGTNVTSAAGGVNRFVFTNAGSNPAAIVGARLLDGDNTGSNTPTNTSGTQLTVPAALSVIPANGNLAIQAADIIPTTITKRSAVIFTIGATSSNIKGTYQLLMPGATTQTVVQMVPASQSN